LSWSPDLLSCLRERFQADHFEPQRKDVERWITEANASGGEIWLTEKDWIKWQRFSSDVDFRGVSVREIALSVKPDSETAWSEWWSEKLVSLDLVDSK
jgi:tetraacyldisaccharide-1-P 4'-kinase